MTPYRSSALTTPWSPDEALARSVAAAHLVPGEEVIWAARPKRGLYFQRSDLKRVPAVVIWVLFAGFVMMRPLLHKASPWAFVIPPLIVLGVAIGFSRVLWQAFETSYRFYALTDQRLLLMRARGEKRYVDEIPLAHVDLQHLAIRYRKNGYADLWLEERFVDGGAGGETYERPPTMVAVPEGDRVYDQIVAARAAHLARAGRIP